MNLSCHSKNRFEIQELIIQSLKTFIYKDIVPMGWEANADNSLAASELTLQTLDLSQLQQALFDNSCMILCGILVQILRL